MLVLSWAANARRACPDAVISELKGRERNGVIAFPEKPQPALFRTNERLQARAEKVDRISLSSKLRGKLMAQS